MPGGDTWDQEAGLLDPNYQLAMLRFREEHMIGGVARRLKRGIDQGMNPGAVFSRVQDHVIAAARAHTERLVLEADLVDTMHVAVAPVEIGRGGRLWHSPDELLDRFHHEQVPSPSGVIHHLFWRR